MPFFFLLCVFISFLHVETSKLLAVGRYLRSEFTHFFFHNTFPEQFTETQKNLEALPGESVTVIAELPESGLEVNWLKDNIPVSMIEGHYQTVNKDCSYELVIPEVTTDDSGEYKAQGGEYESTVSLTVNG